MERLGVRGKWFMVMGLIFSLMVWWTPVLAQEAAEPEAAQKVEAKGRGKAPEDKPTGICRVIILSQYVWRGIALSRNSVVIQPSLTGTYKGIAVNVWNNFDTSGSKTLLCLPGPMTKAHWNETDLTFGYTREVMPARLSRALANIGVIYYALLGDDPQIRWKFTAGPTTSCPGSNLALPLTGK